jgi:hypothetical protein
MNDTPAPGRRDGSDRRKQPTGPWSAFRLCGRRQRRRRAEEHRRPYFVDRFGAPTLVLILLLAAATLADGVLTLRLLSADCEEANPLMSSLLREGVTAFLVGKYVLTVAGLPLLLVFQNHYLFGTRFRVGYLLPLFVALYAGLLAYQLHLCAATAG